MQRYIRYTWRDTTTMMGKQTYEYNPYMKQYRYVNPDGSVGSWYNLTPSDHTFVFTENRWVELDQQLPEGF